MIASGSKGPTQDQILSFLKSSSIDELNHRSSELVDLLSDGNPSGSPVVSSVNGLWIDKRVTIKPQFRKVMDEFYKVHSAQVDFQNKPEDACDAVNAWADKETNGRIQHLLTSEHISSLTRLIFTNALYFKGAWQDEFDASKTEDRDFYLLNGTTINAPFITSQQDQYIGAYDGFKVLRLDYGTEVSDHHDYVQGKYRFRSFSMYIFLPDAKNGLSDLVKKLSSGPGFLKNHLPHCEVEVGDFFIPRFKVSSEFKAAEILKDLGLVLPFTGGLKDVIVSPTEDTPAYVSDILQKSFINVDEKGTEAAAVSVELVMGSAQFFPELEKLDFVADHPFLFAIREDLTGVVLFMGSIVNPIES